MTLFPWCDNTGLLKDVGMIPYFMYKEHRWNSTIACYEEKSGYPYLASEVKGLKLDFFKKRFGDRIDACLYLLKRAKSIDILNVYHLILSKTLLWAIVYKTLNPSGKVYLKLDISYVGIRNHERDLFFKKIVIKKILKKIDVISAESIATCAEMEMLYNVKVLYVPNGYLKSKQSVADVRCKKNNTFLTVARLGCESKATDVLLRAFAESASYHDWNLRLVGSIEEKFQDFIKGFFCQNPHLQERIEFVGEISDRELLRKEYQAAKVFLLPSRWEGFGIVLVEAIGEGCYILASDAVHSANDITNKGEFGMMSKVDSVSDLSKKIILCTKMDLPDSNMIIKFAEDNFEWKTICEKLYEEMVTIK